MGSRKIREIKIRKGTIPCRPLSAVDPAKRDAKRARIELAMLAMGSPGGVGGWYKTTFTSVSGSTPMQAFPDPSTTPTRYANALYVGCLYVVTPADAEASGLDQRFFSRRELVTKYSQHIHPRAGYLTCPIPWPLIRHQISPRGFCRPSALLYFQSHPLIRSVREPDIDQL